MKLASGIWSKEKSILAFSSPAAGAGVGAGAPDVVISGAGGLGVSVMRVAFPRASSFSICGVLCDET